MSSKYPHKTSLPFCTNSVRMVALVAHKFLLDVTHDTLQYQRIRSQSTSSSSSSSLSATGTSASGAASALLGASGGAGVAGNRVVLTMEDLAARYDAHVVHGYYAWCVCV